MATSIRSPARKKTSQNRFVLLGPRQGRFSAYRPLAARVCVNQSEIEEALQHAGRRTIWIALDEQATDRFLNVARFVNLHDIGHFLALKAPAAAAIPALQACFDLVVGVGADFQFLSDAELVEVLLAPPDEAQDLFIGGRIDRARSTLSLIRGNLQQVLVPLDLFQPNPTCSPDPTRFRLSDHGGTICLGEYEASSHSILYEIDPDYRRRHRAKRRAEDRTFGASLGRLRRLKGMSRGDFAPISAKEIARLERDEIAKPHARTVHTIATRLGVTPEEIETF
jgi:hypothetical protein